ncbi:hypothetical protein [Cellvibrio sp. NN19]|uniref:hypothetical protein n=1 Tax=Cellvibrio chitinivorans TaxID=3102792 RepID=UPI002B41659A|nr:hypothetical protein [Cellvibrio sp. NN19]
MKYAILLLLGPGQLEINRLTDLLDSILLHEQNSFNESNFLIINDGNTLLDQLDVYHSQFKTFHVINNPLYGKSKVLFDRHAAGMIYGFSYVYRYLDVDFVVKMDTDVFCINPFAQRVNEFFNISDHVGVAGTFLNWPMGVSRDAAFDDWKSRVENVHKKPLWKNSLLAVRKFKFKAFSLHFIRKNVFRRALDNGYRYGVHIMGGAYAVSIDLIREWARLGYMDHFDLFERSYLGEDSIVTILAYAAGYKMGCFNQSGDVFGVWYKEPEMPAAILKENGYALIHSIKSSQLEDELILRNEYKAVTTSVSVQCT